MANYPESRSPDMTALGVPLAPETALRATTVSAVSWGAIFAGAAGAAALSLVLVVLGTGLGMTSVSPWSSEGIDATTFGWVAAVWLTLSSVAASGVGGYLAGRLRTKATGLHTQEAYFRDTAHGFLAWAVATLAAVVIVSSAVGSAVSSGVKAGASLLGAASSTALVAGATGSAGAMAAGGNESTTGPMGYFVGSLFRTPADNAAIAPVTLEVPAPKPAPPVAEVAQVFANALRTGSLPHDDAAYVARLIAQHTGVAQDVAQKRVSDAFTKVQTTVEEAKQQTKAAADTARKATAYGSLWMVFSLLVGAFVASICATQGGRRRDLQSTL